MTTAGGSVAGSDDAAYARSWAGLVRAVDAVQHAFAVRLESIGMTLPYFSVLTLLLAADEQRLPMSRIAKDLSMTSGGFTKLADRMARDGLIDRRGSSGDRRVVFAALTDEGLAQAKQADSAYRTFLRETFRLLRPGGYVFIRTPRRCGIDTLGRLAERATLGRVDQISDRRVNPGHLHLYNEKSITRQLHSLGFDRIVVEPEAHYTFSTESYLDSAGGPMRVLGRAAPLIDKLIERDWFFRNALMVYARRPAAH